LASGICSVERWPASRYTGAGRREAAGAWSL